MVPAFVVEGYHLMLAFVSSVWHRFPSRGMTVVGITGTDGKSTTVHLTRAVLEAAGYRTAAFSSIEFVVAEKRRQNLLKMTMPGRGGVQRLLAEARAAGCTHVVMEVTSEGLAQHRHRFVDFDVAVLTNLHPEHIEAHGSFEQYRAAKGKLFAATRNTHIINADETEAEYFLQFPAGTLWGYGIEPREDIIAQTTAERRVIAEEISEAEDGGILFTLDDTEFSLPLAGRFNVYNALAAITIGRALNIGTEVAREALAGTSGIAGRMEILSKQPKVVVDYAHTPDALESVYRTLSSGSTKHKAQNPKETQTPGSKSQATRLICVLGSAGGGRDRWKRPELGKLAAQYCDEVVLTNEDPYDEVPAAIIEEIESGFSQTQNPKSNVQKIVNREEAIHEAIRLANPQDKVAITGKGGEPWMVVAGGEKVPWDDRAIVREALEAYRSM